MNSYEDIINLPRHVSPTRPQMPIANRAAQFCPFAALTGYDAAVRETARLTDEKIELSESAISELDTRLRLLADLLGDEPEAQITYFLPDKTKSGGKYVTATGRVRKIDDFERLVIMESGEKIPVSDINSIECVLFPPIL